MHGARIAPAKAGIGREAIPVYSRIALLAQVVDVFFVSEGKRAALKEVRRRAGSWFDPRMVAAFETADGRTWLLEAYFAEPPDEDGIRELARPVVGDAIDGATFDTLGRTDWVKASLEGLKPVRAWRFLVHGAHDRPSVRTNDLSIEIEAALAFGTGHHGTTRGCLLALAAELKRRRPRAVLDVGTGTGILAFAAAKALHSRVVAGDITRDGVSGEGVPEAGATSTVRGLAPAEIAGFALHLSDIW